MKSGRIKEEWVSDVPMNKSGAEAKQEKMGKNV